MQDKRKPEEIGQPRKGVKLKRKEAPQEPEEKINPKVITGVNGPKDMSQPTEDAFKISASMEVARQKLIKSMKDFNQMLASSVLPENRSVSDKEQEKKVIDDLVGSAIEIDRLSFGEGTLALSIFAVRQAIFFRDAGNKLAHEIEVIKKRLDNPIDEKTEASRNYLIEKAKELGIKIDIKD